MEYVIFGESHGPAIGVTLTGVPAGLVLDMDFIQAQMGRRAPGQNALSTARRETDMPTVLSGVFNGKTTGSPLTATIPNSDQHSSDYRDLAHLPRPSHADYTGFVRYKGCNDYRGGGHFSGRLTAPLVFAGAVAQLILAQQNIQVVARISSIFGISDAPLDTETDLLEVRNKPFPVLDDEAGKAMQQAILDAKAEGDSVGGSIECAVLGLPAGLGDPDVGKNVEGIFAKHLFAVPAVKSLGFGAGVALAYMRGSEANDPFFVEDGKVMTRSNHAGGVNGGITNGMPVLFEVTLRPTPSIAQGQQTVDLDTMTETTHAIQGRHDPCVVQRAVPAIEAAAALAACEVLGI